MSFKNPSIHGFSLPLIYKKNQTQVESCLNEGNIDYADLSQWTFPDEFYVLWWNENY